MDPLHGDHTVTVGPVTINEIPLVEVWCTCGAVLGIFLDVSLRAMAELAGQHWSTMIRETYGSV